MQWKAINSKGVDGVKGERSDPGEIDGSLIYLLFRRGPSCKTAVNSKYSITSRTQLHED
jgi:hypothetical protein